MAFQTKISWILWQATPLLIAASLAFPFCAAQAAEEGDAPAQSAGPAEILSIAAGTGRKEAEAITGDSDYSGEVTASDAALMLRYELGYCSTMPLPGGIDAVPTLADTRLAVERIIAGTFQPDVADLLAELAASPPRTYAALAERKPLFSRLAEALLAGVYDAASACMPTVSHDFAAAGRRLNPVWSLPDAPDWKSVAALYYVYGENLTAAFSEAIQASWSGGGEGPVGLTLRYAGHDAAAAWGSNPEIVRAKLAYAYLNTVYDADGAEKTPESWVYDQAYLDAVIHPLPGCTIKNGWFDPRDNHTRYHTGTDILAKGRTHILSATDGEVLFVGYLPVPGNYVIIRDPYGFEYHYYHMFEQSKFVKPGDVVKRGDVIGRVGNTGNSAANHLHLTIVTPEYAYVNPYDLYLQAGATPIRLDG